MSGFWQRLFNRSKRRVRPRSSLSADQIRAIRDLDAEGLTQAEIAQELKVSERTVRRYLERTDRGNEEKKDVKEVLEQMRVRVLREALDDPAVAAQFRARLLDNVLPPQVPPSAEGQDEEPYESELEVARRVISELTDLQDILSPPKTDNLYALIAEALRAVAPALAPVLLAQKAQPAPPPLPSPQVAPPPIQPPPEKATSAPPESINHQQAQPGHQAPPQPPAATDEAPQEQPMASIAWPQLMAQFRAIASGVAPEVAAQAISRAISEDEALAAWWEIFIDALYPEEPPGEDNPAMPETETPS